MQPAWNGNKVEVSHKMTTHSGDRTWHFRTMQKSEMNYDPIQGEFFTNQDIADRLVRETLQNSLDADLKNGRPVHVRFSLQSETPLAPSHIEPYFRGLQLHLETTLDPNAPGREVLDHLDGRSAVPYLLIEDFNTTGLTGDVERYTDQDPDDSSDDNHFFWFVRNVGRSGKRGLERGSWGVGKWVFPDASKINTFLFLTHRNDDSQSLLMGQSVLRQHTLGDTRHQPYGYFADIELDSGFAGPIDSDCELDLFTRGFGLKRKAETGLSIVIPFPDEGLDRNAILRAAISYCFSPILDGSLVVHVSDEDRELRVDHETIYEIIDHVDWDSTSSNLSPEDRHSMFNLVQEHATIADRDMITSVKPEPNEDPTRMPFPDRFDAEQLEIVRNRFEAGEVLVFRVRIWVHPKANSPRLSWLDIIVQRDNNFKGTHTEYVRNDLTIPEAGPRRLGIASNLRSLLIVSEDHLAALLRDSEEPSHSRWKERATRVRDRYDLGASTVRFVNGVTRNIVQCLTSTQEKKHRDLLKEFFSIPSKGRKRTRPSTPPPSGRSPFRISTRQGGFTIRVEEGDDATPEQLRIRVAYDTRRGNPISRYDPRDFQLDSPDFSIDYDNCAPSSVELNQMLVDVKGSNAEVTVKGFDPNRDLLVQVDAIANEPVQ